MITTDLAPVTGPGLGDFAFPANEAVFAIGDVHGQAETLRALCKGIAATDTGARHRHVVFLGDAIDRGPASLDTLDLLVNELGELTRADTVTLLPGNHELMMAGAIDEARAGHVCTDQATLWLGNGGITVLLEVFEGTPVELDLEAVLRMMNLAQTPSEARKALDPLLPRMGDLMRGFVSALKARGVDPIEMVRTMPSHVRVGPVLCVHAGVNPKLALDTALGFKQDEHLQVRDHWAWVREPFLANQRGWFEAPTKDAQETGGLLVLHGHTVPKKWGKHPSDDPDRIARVFDRMETNARVCVDFGAGANVGVGACLVTNEGRQLMFEPCESLSA